MTTPLVRLGDAAHGRADDFPPGSSASYPRQGIFWGMAFGAGIVGLALLTLWVYCIFDVIRTDEASARNLPKLVWLLVVVFLPTVGSLAWLLLGRPSLGPYRQAPYRRPRPTSPRSSRPRAARGPEDSPEFLSELERRARELKRRRGEDR